MNFDIIILLPIIITIFISIGAIIYLSSYYTIQPIIDSTWKKGWYDGVKKGNANKRKVLLKKAKQFLSPYKNIWQNQTLTNSIVKIKLKKKTLILYHKDYQYKYDFIKKENINLIWNYILDCFSVSTDFNYIYELIQDCCKQNNISFKYSAKKIKSKVSTIINKLFKERTVDI